MSLSSVALPFGLGLALATGLYSWHGTVNGRQIEFLALALFVGVVMSITAFPVLAGSCRSAGCTGPASGC